MSQPFLPDFWTSSEVKAQEQKPPQPERPKISLAAGAETYPAGGPTFNLSPAGETDLGSVPSLAPSTPSGSAPRKYSGLVGDVLDDLGVPHDVLASSSIAKERGPASTGRGQSRPLDADEKRGVYVLLGLLLGSWGASSVLAPSRKSESQKH